MKVAGKKRRISPPNKSVGHSVHSNCSCHNKSQRKIPRTEHVEKSDNFFRTGHSGNSETKRKNHSHEQSCKIIFHGNIPNLRKTNTDSIPAAMKVRVATNDLGDIRLMPQTPCPLVQPLPSKVPNPTKRPATITVQGSV